MRATQALFSKSRNLLDVVIQLPRDGIGSLVRRTTWPPQSHWEVTEVKLSVKPSLEGKNHGKVWGMFTWKGSKQNKEPKRVRGALKKVWRVTESATSEASPAAAPTS